LLSISPELAISYSLMLLFFAYLPLALVGLILWLRNPIKLKD
jgi:hypothetical protein